MLFRSTAQKPELTAMRKEHPEWVLGLEQAPGWCSTSWNLAVPEVRQHILQLVTEACRQADWDGVELDWQRHAFHLPADDAYRLRYTLTDLMRAIRAATEAIAASPDRPVGVPVTVDLDALIDPHHRARIAAVYTDIQAALFWVTIVNYDERRADPRDACTVISFVDTLAATGVPVVLSHVGRTGLLAIAVGAAGYAAGTCGLETHPRSFFREMMGSRPANSYYLHEGLVHTPVRTAEACLRLDETNRHPTCDCAACEGNTAISLMVSRRLALHAVLRRLTEVDVLGAIDPQDRRAYLVDRFSRARNRSTAPTAAKRKRAGEGKGGNVGGQRNIKETHH